MLCFTILFPVLFFLNLTHDLSEDFLMEKELFQVFVIRVRINLG